MDLPTNCYVSLPLLRSELLHEVHHHGGTLLLAAAGREAPGAVRALGLPDDHDPGGAPRHLLDVHRLQLGEQPLGSLGGAERERE